MSLIALTSPAKSMDERSDWQEALSVGASQPRHLDTAAELVAYLRDKSESQLQEILGVSNDLTELNYERFQKWQREHTPDTSKPALLLYAGQVYKMFEAADFSGEEQERAQRSVRILSGLYGLLRAYDLIQPYRLEMKTPLEYVGDQSLAAFWSDPITEALVEDARTSGAEAIINLASNEYFNAVDTEQLPVPVIDVDFKEERDGGLRTIAIYAKKARGAMLGYIVEHGIETLEDLKKFDALGYSLQKAEDKTLLFTRADN